MKRALAELQRIANLAAFSVAGHYYRKRQNGFSTVYLFDDGSRLEVNTRAQMAKAFNAHTGGQRIGAAPIQANRTSGGP